MNTEHIYRIILYTIEQRNYIFSHLSLYIFYLLFNEIINTQLFSFKTYGIFFLFLQQCFTYSLKSKRNTQKVIVEKYNKI